MEATETRPTLASLIRTSGYLKGFVAEKLGMPQSSLSRLLSGDRRMTLSEALKAAELFGVPVETFAEGAE